MTPWEALTLRMFVQAVRDASGSDEKNKADALLFLRSPWALDLADLLGYDLRRYAAGVEVLTTSAGLDRAA